MLKVQALRAKYRSLDIEVDGGLSPTTIHKAAEVCKTLFSIRVFLPKKKKKTKTRKKKTHKNGKKMKEVLSVFFA